MVSLELAGDMLLIRKALAAGPAPSANEISKAAGRLAAILRPKDGRHIGDTMQRALVLLRDEGRPMCPLEMGRCLGFVTHHAKRVLLNCVVAGYAVEVDGGCFAFNAAAFE